MVDNWLITEGVGDIKVKRTGKVTTILCAGMIGIGVLTGCSQTNGNGATNGSTGSSVNSVRSANGTSKIDTQKEISEVQSMNTVLNTMTGMEKKIIVATESYLQITGGQYDASMASSYDGMVSQVVDAINQEQVTFDSAYAHVANEGDERPIVRSMDSLFSDIKNSNLTMETALSSNDSSQLNDATGQQQTVANDISELQQNIDYLLKQLGATSS